LSEDSSGSTGGGVSDVFLSFLFGGMREEKNVLKKTDK
jgi:hypothetical protein